MELEFTSDQDELRDSIRAVLAANAEAEYKRVVELVATGKTTPEAEQEIFGTTHADYFHGAVPVTGELTSEEIATDYEKNTGLAITRLFDGIGTPGIPAVLVAGHGPFCWGKSVTDAAHSAGIVEEIAAMACLTVTINPSAAPIAAALRDKHHFRKHGPTAYYGQGKG